MIITKGIIKSFGSVHVLKGINLTIARGEIVTIVGASGAGKSTLLQIIGTIEKANEGSISINKIDISTLSERKIAEFRNQHIGFVFQFHHLLPEFTALENVCIPAFIAKTSRKEAEKKAASLLDFLGLHGRMHHKPSELSGGEQQRVAVARSLINSPSIILADEPSGNLDSNAAMQLHELFFDLRKQFKQTFVIVTHNQQLAQKSDRILKIKDGFIENQA